MRIQVQALLALGALTCIAWGTAMADDGTGNIACEFHPEELPMCEVRADALLPDLMTVVPTHLSIQNEHQREMLRFSNGLANVGVGPWWLEPNVTTTGTDTCQAARQVITGPEHFVNRQIMPSDDQIPAPEGTFATRCDKGNFDFHETHNHWHIDNVGEFRVCTAADFNATGDACTPALTTYGTPSEGIKYTFCLIDWYKLGDNSANSDETRNFFDCATGFQGVSPGWVDQYHHSTAGQEVDITGLPAGEYVLVSTINPSIEGHRPIFEEMNVNNNTSWLRFELRRDSEGNAKVLNKSGSCDDPAYLKVVQQSVQAFVDTYHNGNAAFAAAVVDDMCGGKSTNK